MLYRLPDEDVRYVREELKNNKFFFDKMFYQKLKELLEKLSLAKELPQFIETLKRSSI